MHAKLTISLWYVSVRLRTLPEYGDGVFPITYGEECDVDVFCVGIDSWSRTEIVVRPPQACSTIKCAPVSELEPSIQGVTCLDMLFFFRAGEEKSYFISPIFLTFFQMRLWVCNSDGRFYITKFS